MDKLFWVIPGTLAGRPGPDQAPWDLAALRAGGIGAILSVNDGLLCHPQDFAVADITYACMPLSANAPPQPEDEHICRRALPQAYAFVQAQMGQGHGVVVTARGAKIVPASFSAISSCNMGGSLLRRLSKLSVRYDRSP